VRATHVSDQVQRYVYRIVEETRRSSRLTLGASPRAGVALLLASQAAAAIDGRDFATPDDVKDVAPLTLPHRVIVHPEAEIEGARAADVVSDILGAVPVPRE
jgi:MoxR-like ATPase